ncbi:hypothetical protein KQI84_07945 [bacterium]|nr:hypothetical protein [bacterium]
MKPLRKRAFAALIAAFLVLLGALAIARGGAEFEISRYAYGAGGGIASTGDGYEVSGMACQAGASGTSSADGLDVAGGFWIPASDGGTAGPYEIWTIR